MTTTRVRHTPSNYLISNGNEPKEMLQSIEGYATERIVPLEESCESLCTIISRLKCYVSTAKNESKHPASKLSEDESAAIRLYTMQWDEKKDGHDASLYAHLNAALREPDRTKLKPWFRYLKLLLTALTKIPYSSGETVWRGLYNEDSTQYTVGDNLTWWGFSSCTRSLNILKDQMFLNRTDKRTIFSIEIIDGRFIQDHSHFPIEEEILLLPGTCLPVHAKLSPLPDLHIIQLKQVPPHHELLERPFTANDPFTHTIASVDAIYLLSQKYNCTVEEILSVNPGIEPKMLKIGQVVRLPTNASKPENQTSSEEQRNHFIRYTIVRGDTCDRIAEWYDCTLQDLINANPNLKPHLIYPGQVLLVPRNHRTKNLPDD